MQDYKKYYLEHRDKTLLKRKEYYLKNKEHINNRVKEYSLKNNKRIKAYKEEYRLKNRSEINRKLRIYFKNWRDKNPELAQQRNANTWKRKRYEIFDVLGGAECTKCGFSDWRALQIDHINGGGNKEVKTFTSVSQYNKNILENPSLYQVLCANCNWIKRSENKEVRKSI